MVLIQVRRQIEGARVMSVSMVSVFPEVPTGPINDMQL